MKSVDERGSRTIAARPDRKKGANSHTAVLSDTNLTFHPAATSNAEAEKKRAMVDLDQQQQSGAVMDVTPL